MMKNLTIAVEEKYALQKLAAEAMGIDEGNLSKMLSDRDPSKIRAETVARIKKAFPEYNIDWIKEKSSIKLVADIERLSNIHPSPDGDGLVLPGGKVIGKTKPITGSEMIPSINSDKVGAPYFDIDFMGGFDLIFNNQVEPSYYIDFLPFNDVDAWINVTGKSMGPLIAHGDIVALKRVEDWKSFLLEGEIYAIITSNGFRTIKILGKGDNEDSFMLIPYNKSEEYQPQPIPKSVITHVFRVKGAIKKFF